MRRLWRTGIILIVGLCVLGVGVWAWQNYRSTPDAVSFRTAKAEKGDLAATIGATGTIEPEEVIDVGAQVAAQIKNFGRDPNDSTRAIDYGTHVQANTLLAQLDDSLFKARAEQAQAAVDGAQASVVQAEAGVRRADADLLSYRAKYNQAERDWERAQQLRLSRNIADVEFDQSRANYETTKAAVTVAEAAVGQAQATRSQAEKARGKAEATMRE